MSDPVWSWSAVATADRLREGSISPREVLAAVRARVESIDPIVNALPTRCFDRADRMAALLEAAPPDKRGRFAGLPWPIKDSAAVAGVRTTYGSLAFADHVPQASAPVVDVIEREGGIVFAKSNTPEFEAGANTFNDVFGATLNPWDLSRSAGGSSGGAAVAVATGMAFLAHGSDFACSLRYPAAFCNVVGLRPSPGLVPYRLPALPNQTLSVMGPLARTVSDVAFALDGMVSFDPRDPLSRPRDGTTYLKRAQEARPPPRAAFSMTLGVAHVDRPVRNAVGAALATLASAGLRADEAHPNLASSEHAFRTLRAFQFAALHRKTLLRHREKLKPEVVWNIEEGLRLSAGDIAAAEVSRGLARRHLIDFLDRHDVLMTPTAPVEPFPVEKRYVDEIDGVKLETYLDWMVLGYAVSVAGCPAISIPCGRSENGLPIGLQLIGKPYGEAELLRTAAWCEAVLGAAMIRPMDPVRSV